MQDSSKVARNMRFSKKIDGLRLFKMGKHLSPHQVQSYFSWMAAKLRQSNLSEEDIEAVEDHQMLDVIQEGVPSHCVW